MKKILLLFIGLCIGVQSFAQNGALHQSWYLMSYELNGASYGVSAISPHISPSLTIESNLEFSGVGACNSYLGNFSYDSVNDQLILDAISITLTLCDYQSHVDFENDYFGFFPVAASYNYSIIYDNNDEYLDLILNPGLVLHYRNSPLSISGQILSQIKIYPNPTTNKLFIVSDAIQLEKISIFNIAGNLALELTTSETEIDVSNLSAGIYFLEITTSEGKSMQRFIKK